jgi:galactokinase
MIDLPTLINQLTGATILANAPGRVNLLGEHVDYNCGIVLPIAIDRRVYVAARPRADQRVNLHALDLKQKVSFNLKDCSARIDVDGKPLPAWALYPAGVAWILLNKGFNVIGVDAVYSSDVPIGAGLSSSAAVEVAFAVLWQALSGWKADRMTLAQICQMAENKYVGVNCGLMDQFASAHGVARHALFFDTRSLDWRPLPLPPGTAVVVADSGVRRELANSAYNERRASCEKAVELLKSRLPAIQSLRDVTPDQLHDHADLLSEEVYKRARHVVEEINRVNLASEYLLRDDAKGFGKLMFEGHQSLRDLYEVSCPELDALVEIASGLPGCFGSRLTGAGFGGCMVNLVEAEKTDGFIKKLKEEYFKKTKRKTEVTLCQASRGAYIENIPV